MSKANIPGVPSGSESIRDFERMLAELSARFINLPVETVDDAINDALRRIAALLGVDRSQLIRFSPQDNDADLTHSGAVGDAPAVAPKSLSALYPWVIRQLREGHPVVIPDVDALPMQAAVDRASFRRAGTRANLTVPLQVGGRVEGAIAFGSLSAAREWPEELIARVNVLADVFANALDHQRAQEALNAALRFEQLVSEILVALLTVNRGERDRVIDAGLDKVARSFGAERATLWQRVDDDEFKKTHRWLDEGAPKAPETIVKGAIPWIRSRLLAGEIVRFASHADLPSDAHADLHTLRELGIRAGVMVPLSVAGSVVGALSLASVSADRTWPDALLPRMKLLGDVFANMFAQEASERREHDAQAPDAQAAR